MEGMPEKIDSKFRFVLLAAHRVEQMMRGAKPKVEPSNRKLSRIALQEILNDKVDWDYGPAEAEAEGDVGATEAEPGAE